MKYGLIDFQKDAVTELLKKIESMRRSYDADGSLSAVSLTAPTGAGKTVISAAVAEGLFYGNDTYAGDDRAAILWLSDSPSLNEQTMKRFDAATDMYVVSTRGIWNADNEPGISYISYTRLKEWKYTEKGWFCYELCVPEPPEVSEIVDGSCLIRIKPMTEEQREMSEHCVRGLGYQGNNLLCSNWNIENLNELDYNGMFEYLYGMKYGEKFNSEDYPNGIPKEEFESLIMEYLPIIAEQIRDYAVFDEENQTYYWVRLGCFNYAPTFFGTFINNNIAYKVEKELCETPLPEKTELIESISRTGKLTGNGNGMQYFGAILIQSELSLKELDDYYSDHRSNEWEYLVEIQEGQSIDVIDNETLNFGKEINDAGYYIVYSWESENSLLKELDIRGH
jgi:hypothetical protein